jgi:hygromycin-B 7''-O-kinase
MSDMQHRLAQNIFGWRVMHIPAIQTEADYRGLYQDEENWSEAIQAIAIRHGLHGQPRRLPLGTHIVYAVDDLVIKLFSPFWAEDYEAERAVLTSKPRVVTPQIVAQGKLEAWPYLLLTQVPGGPAEGVWADLSMEVRRRLIQEIGTMLRCLHGQDLAAGHGWNRHRDWNRFLAQRLGNADIHHAAQEPFRSWIQRELRAFVELPYQQVLLHGDLTRDHFFLAQAADGAWSVSGLIDFGDARMGHPFYDFIALLIDYTLGEPELSRLLLAAYGLPVTPTVTQVLTRYCLLHEFTTLGDVQDKIAMQAPEDFHRALWG